ncbi:hypothetical protein [Nibribacter koreensis]|uniref:YD repeat-containing protein n=1 Tax=Nibribacter koreensis TaxID=1084519 RepID=A0ABP8FDH4_9BACT
MIKHYLFRVGRACLFLPLFCTLLLTGCEDPTQPENDGPKKLVVKTARTGDEPTREYVFDRLGNLTKVVTQGDTTSWKVEYFYDAQGRFYRQKEGAYTFTGEYNAQNQLVKHLANFSIGGVSEDNFYLHTYNAQGQLQETTYHSPTDPTYVLYRFKYFYSNGVNDRIEKTMYAGNGPFIEDITITYDGKKQPIPYLPLVGVNNRFRETPLIEYAAGNVVDYRIVNRIDGSKNPTSYNVAYTYNDQGYPIEALLKNGFSTTKTSYTYTYQ